MLREETDERIDYRAAKADGHIINNHKACDICTHEIAYNKDVNRNRLSQNLLDKGDYRFSILTEYLQIPAFFNQSITNTVSSTKVNSIKYRESLFFCEN